MQYPVAKPSIFPNHGEFFDYHGEFSDCHGQFGDTVTPTGLPELWQAPTLSIVSSARNIDTN